MGANVPCLQQEEEGDLVDMSFDGGGGVTVPGGASICQGALVAKTVTKIWLQYLHDMKHVGEGEDVDAAASLLGGEFVYKTATVRRGPRLRVLVQ